MIAPTTHSPAAMRKPVKMAGVAPGSSSLRKRVHRPTPWTLKRSWCAASADSRPKNVFDRIGNRAMITHTMIRERKPSLTKRMSFLAHRSSRGTMARIGTVCSTIAHG